jgi:hypothetical protein
MCKSTKTNAITGQIRLFRAISSLRTKSLANQVMYFVQFLMNVLVPTVLTAFYFIIKGLPLVHKLVQLNIEVSNESWTFCSIIVFLWIQMYIYDQGSIRKGYAYRCQQAFNKFHTKKEFWALQLSFGSRQEKQSYHIMKLLWSEEIKVTYIEIVMCWSSNWQMATEDNRHAARKQLPNILDHHHYNHL